MEIIEGQPRAEILFVGYHHAAGWRLLPENRRQRRVVESSRPRVENRTRKRALRGRQHTAAGRRPRGHPASFTARDASSSIERAQYSLDGGDWILVVPNTGISDALVEHYDFGLPALTPGEHTIAVRAYDRLENVGSAKTIFTVPPAKP